MKPNIDKFPLLKLGLKTLKKWWKNSTTDVIYDQIVLGKPEQGIIIQLDDKNNNLLTCPIASDTMIIAETETLHQDEIFASSWTDFRSSRITENFPASTRVLDCCIASLVRFVEENKSSTENRFLPDRYTFMSCSDGYDHPILEEEQILIATAAFLCSQHLNVEFAKLIKERMKRGPEQITDWNSPLSYGDIMAAMDAAQEQVRASLAALPSADMNMDVGMGNVSIVAFPSLSLPLRSQTTSTDSASPAAVAAGDSSSSAAHEIRHSTDAPSSTPWTMDRRTMYDVITLGVGDCAAIALTPRADGRDDDFDCLVLYQPVEYPLFGQTNVYGPTSFLDTDKHRDRAIDSYKLPEHSVLVLLTDGCWSHFSKGSEKKSRFVEDGKRSQYIEHQLDVEAMKQVVLGLPSYARRDARAIASAFRTCALHRSETRRQQLAHIVAQLETYRTSSDFDAASFQYMDTEKGRNRPYLWKQHMSMSVKLPQEIIDICTTLIDIEGFSEEVPILTLLDYRPVCGDDASILVHVLPSSAESIVRAMLDVCREAAVAVASTVDSTVVDSLLRDKDKKLDVWFQQLHQLGLFKDEDAWKAPVRAVMSKAMMDMSVEGVALSGSVVPTLNLLPLLLEDKEKHRITCHRPIAMTEEHLLTRFYTRRGVAESTVLHSKYDSALVTELMDFICSKIASMRELR